MNEIIIKDYLQTNIWKTFESKADASQIVFVQKLVDFSQSLLKKYSDTFPRYTEHSGTHQINILKLISNLLGDRINKLSVLECAFIILSTFFHDIGMVFTEEERENLNKSESFPKFLSENPQANLDYLRNNSIVSKDLAEWFCRWSHASRVYVYLKELDKGKIIIGGETLSLKWLGKTSLHNKLGLVCESHNWATEKLKDIDFDTSFLGEADLRFCSILLRLGDILDFDDTRTEESIFKYYLKLDQAKIGSEKFSKREWEKHLCSSGFQFTTEQRDIPYEIRFIASPEKPETEVGVKDFLNYIDTEIRNCREILPFCSEKWRTLQLPNTIKREIHSQNYKSGAFNFTLDQKQVLNLLMGENLYRDSYICIRELLQNAIDTSRHREVYERNTGKQGFKATSIKVSEWEDNEGYKWIRFDDFGMGMNEQIIKNYFLKVGNSYYNSPEFEAEKIGYKNNDADFTPISRFGIGVLSCFLIADKIEVSSYKQNSSPLRLSIEGVNDYYVLNIKTERHHADSFPSENGTEEEYRTDLGTSIAIRIDPVAEKYDFNLKETLEKWLFCPPVPVELAGKRIGGEPELLEKPLFDRHIEYLSEEDHAKIEEFYGQKYDEKFGIEYIPYSVTKESLNINLKGQLVVAQIVTPNSFLEKDNNVDDEKVKFKYKQHFKTEKKLRNTEYARREYEESLYMKLEFSKPVYTELSQKQSNYLEIKLENFSEIYDQINKNYFISGNTNSFYNNKNNLDQVVFSHNGIFFSKAHIDHYLVKNDDKIIMGAISFFDTLRPNLTIERSEYLKLNFSTKYALQIAMNNFWDILREEDPLEKFLLQNDNEYLNFHEISIKNIYKQKNVDFWKDNLVFEINGELLTIKKIKEKLDSGSRNLNVGYVHYEVIRFRIANAVLQSEFNIAYTKTISPQDTNSYDLVILDGVNPNLTDGLQYFPGLYFVKIIGSDKLIYSSRLNLNHPFSIWLIENYVFLASNHNGYLLKILDFIEYLKSPIQLADYDVDKSVESINKVLKRIQKVIGIGNKYYPDASIFLNQDSIF
jgi:hypothetical protein